MSFLDTIERAKSFLERNGRVSLGALRREFDLDDDALEELVEELVDIQQVAARQGKALAWMGNAGQADQTEAAAERDPTPETATEAERRQLTVFFCDLVDSTRLAAGMDPEDWREVVRGYQEAASGVVEQFEGHVAQYLGDGLLVYFGWPRAHEDDAERAVRAGLGIVEAIRELGTGLAVRVGIHTGPVVVGEMGGGASRETLAMGDTTNVAAHIQGEADPGMVTLSSATLRLVSGVFVTEDLGGRELKGAGAVHLHRALRPSGMQSRLDVAAATGLTPFVGREQELMLLDDRFAEAMEGAGQAVLVCGEAGIGKSRFLQAFRERVVARAHTWLECRCSPYTRDSALEPILELLRQALRFRLSDPTELKLERLERGLRTAGFDLASTLPLMAALHGLPLPEGFEIPVLSPEARRKRTLELLVEWLVRLGDQQAVVLVMDDLHWMDPSTLELLGGILDQIARAHVLLVLTYRPDFEPPWPPRSHATPLLLPRLPRPQLGDLIRKATRGEELPKPWIELIVRRADGVPLFAEELTRAVLSSHPELPTDGALPELEIPETLQDSLMARLDALGPIKELAQLGAVLGREFSYDLLLKVSPLSDEDLRVLLEKAVREELFYQRGIPPEATFLFKHALLRDAAYQSLLRSARERHHRRVAETLIERIPNVAETRPELVAHHLTEAGEAETAIAYWQRAGARASQRMENAEAVLHLRSGLGLLDRIPDPRDRAHRELELQMALGAPLMALKGYSSPECEEAFGRARELCQESDDAPLLGQALFGLAMHYYSRAQLPGAAEIAIQLLETAKRTANPSQRVLGHLALGVVCFEEGETLESIEHLEKAVELYEPARDQALAAAYGWDPDVLARSLLSRGLAQVGRLDRARELSREALERGRASQYAHSLAMAKTYAALLHQLRCEVPESLECAEQGQAISEEQELTVTLGATIAFRGWGLTAQGKPDGLDQIREGLAMLAPTGFQLGAPLFLGLLAEGQINAGQPEEALGTLDAALGIAAANDNGFWNAELLRLKGETLSADDSRREEAEGLLGEAVELSRRKQWRLFELRSATSLARLWQTQGKRTEARELLQPVYDCFTEGFDTQNLQDAKALLGELA